MGKEYIREIFQTGLTPSGQNQILYDNFEDALFGAQTGNGSDWLIELQAASGYMGNKSLYMQTKSTTPALNDWVSLRRQIFIPSSGIVKLTAIVKIDSLANAKQLNFHYLIADQIAEHDLGVVLRPNTADLAYYNNIHVVTQIPGSSHIFSAGYFFYFSFVVDLINITYRSAQINSRLFDLSTLAGFKGEEDPGTSGYLDIRLLSTGADVATCHIDQLSLVAP